MIRRARSFQLPPWAPLLFPLAAAVWFLVADHRAPTRGDLISWVMVSAPFVLYGLWSLWRAHFAKRASDRPPAPKPATGPIAEPRRPLGRFLRARAAPVVLVVALAFVGQQMVR